MAVFPAEAKEPATRNLASAWEIKIMGTLYKRGDVYWAQVYHRGKRRRISLHTSNYGVARSKVRKLEHEMETRGLQTETHTPVDKVITKFVEYLIARGGCGRKGPQTDIYRLAEFFGPVCEVLENNSRARNGIGPKSKARKRKTKKYDCAVKVDFLEDVTSGMVQDYLVKLQRRRGLSPKTLNEYREVLQRLFNWAIKTRGVRMPGQARHNPVADVERFATSETSIRFLSIKQVHEQLEALTDEPCIQTLVAVYIYAGLRREEALWLTHEDVDRDQGLIHVRAKTVADRTWQPKTRKNRTVPISKALMEYLEAYTPNPLAPWFFPSPGGCWQDPDNFSQKLRRLNDKTGLPWGCLDFRHTFGSHLAMKGESLYKISKIMGNSPEICRRHYAALTPESLVGCVDFDESSEGPVSPERASGAPRLRLVV